MKLRPCSPAGLDLVGLGQNSVDHVISLDRYPARGEKVAAQGYQLLPGGQVATAVLAAQRMGARCAYIGAVGDDHLSGLATQGLEGQGVEVLLRRVAGGRSQLATILVSGDGDRTIIQHYDARVVMRTQDLQGHRAVIQQARALHLDITDPAAAILAAGWAREAGALVSLDIDRLLPGAEDLFPLVDLLLASEGLPAELGYDSPRVAMEALRGQCPGVVGITLGEGGCLMWAPDRDEPIAVPAFAVEAVDTTGCGDVFRGALVAALLQAEGPLELERAARFAAAAALQAREVGAQPAVPDLAAVKSFLANDPPVRDI